MERLLILPLVGFFSFSIFCVGNFFIRKLNCDNNINLNSLLISFLIGYGIISYLIFFLGTFGGLSKILFSVYFILIVGTISHIKLYNSYEIFSYLKDKWYYFFNYILKNKILIICALSLISSVIMSGICMHAYPSDGDSLGWHLAGPKYFIKQGAIDLFPFYLYWGSPMLSAMWNIVSLLSGSAILAQAFQWFIGIISSLMLYILISNRFSRLSGLVGATIYYLTPKFIAFSSTATYDLAFLAFIFASLHTLLLWEEEKNINWLILSSIFTGFTLATKYHGLYWALSIGILLVYLLGKRWRKNFVNSIKIIIIFTMISLVVVSPWYIRNFFVTGDPVWPLGYTLFQSNYWSQFLHDKYSSWHVGPGTSLLHYFSGLWNLTLNQSNWPGGLKQPYVLFQLILLPGLIFFWKHLKINDKRTLISIIIPIIISYMLWFTGYQHERYVMPVMSLLLVPTSIVFSKLLKLHFAKYAAIFMLSLTLTFSICYQFIYTKEFIPVVFGLESRDSFLRKKVPFYDDFKWVNDQLPKNSKILTNYLRTFYFEHDYAIVPSYLNKDIKNMSNAEFISYLNEESVTHLFIVDESYERLIRELKDEKLISHIYANIEAKRITSRTLGHYENAIVNVYRINYL